MEEMTSTKPYFVKAIYQWIVDNKKTPYIDVNVAMPNVSVPPQYVKDGRIILDINPNAVDYFVMDLKAISFEARFDSRVLPVFVPMYAINAIFAVENGQGMSFPPEEALADISLISSLSSHKNEEIFDLQQKSKPLDKIEKKKPKLVLIDNDE